MFQNEDFFEISTRLSARSCIHDVIDRHIEGGRGDLWDFFFFSCAFCHPGNQLPVTFIFTGVRRTTWLRTRLSFLCQNIITTSHHCVIGMSKDLLDYPFCHDVNKYEKMVKIGQGTFGFVACFTSPFSMSLLESSLHATALIVSIVLQRGIQGAESKEPQRNRCPQEGPYGQRERRGILCSC